MTTKNNLKVRALCEGAIMLALAVVLGYIKLLELPQGGSVCIGMLPVFLFCARWGWKEGFTCSFAYGILQLLLDGAYAWGPLSMVLDYILAFGVLGLAGFFRGSRKAMFTGIFAACLARFIVHFISGITIYRIFAPTELFNMTLTDPYIYSAVYNGSFVGIDMILCMVIVALLYKPLERYLTGRDLGQTRFS